MSATIVGCGCGCTTNADPCKPCGGAVSIASYCSSRSGTQSLCGYEEFTSPSVPPKKYLTLRFSGKNTVKKFAGPGCAGALVTGTCIVTVSGANSYSASSSGCAGPSIGGEAVVEAGGPPTTVPITAVTDLFCGINCGSVESTTQRTKIILKAVLTGGGTGCASECQADGDEMSQALENEDTDQAAIARSAAVWSEYQLSSQCCSGIEPRTAGFVVGFTESKMRLIITGPKGGTANIDVPFSRVTYGSVPTMTSWVDVHQVAFGSSGEAQLDITIPNKRGFTTCAGPAYLSRDQPAQ